MKDIWARVTFDNLLDYYISGNEELTKDTLSAIDRSPYKASEIFEKLFSLEEGTGQGFSILDWAHLRDTFSPLAISTKRPNATDAKAIPKVDEVPQH